MTDTFVLPELTPDEEAARQKAELIKLAAPPAPTAGTELLLPPPTNAPARPVVAPEPGSLQDRFAPVAVPAPKPPTPQPTAPPEMPTLAGLLPGTKAPPVEAEFKPAELPKSKDVHVVKRAAASGIPPVGMALLDTIATREAEPAFEKGKRAGWNTMVGGERFDPSTSEHPHKAYPEMRGFVGGAGRSFASGRYQETTATYYENVARSARLHPGVNVSGWSEEAQNIRNWDKAQEVYRRFGVRDPKLGLTGDLETDLTNNLNNPEAIGRISRALNAEWTSAPGGREGSKLTGGKESYYGNTFVNMMKGQPGELAGSELAQLLNPEPMATQNVPLTGGRPDTPEAAAQTAALMTGTPIERIKAITDTMRQAAARGTVQNRLPMLPQTTRTVRGETMPQGDLYSVTHTEPTLPIPGMEPSMISQATGPSLLSTIMQHQDIPLPLPQAPSEVVAKDEEQKSILDRITNTVQSLRPSNWPVREVLAGVAQQPTAAANATIGNAALLTNILTGNQAAGDIYKSGVENAEAWRQGVRSFLGLPEAKEQTGGEYAGQVLSPSVGRTLFGAAVGKGLEYIQPSIMKLGEQFPIPQVIGEAKASDSIFGEVPEFVNTPNGPMQLNRATKSGLIYGATAASGVGFLPAVVSNAARVAIVYPSRWMNSNAIRREVVGAPGTWTASMPQDVLKATTVDPVRAMQNALDRLARTDPQRTNPGFWAMMFGRDHGIDPVAAEAVRQRWRVQTNSGGQIHISNAIETGRMNTPEYQFSVNTPIKAIDEYARANPDFMHYLKVKMVDEQLTANRTAMYVLPSGKPRPANMPVPASKQRPLSYTDDQRTIFTQGRVPGATSTRQLIQGFENGPMGAEFKQMYKRIQENLQATRDFVSSHPRNNVEHPLDLMTHAIDYPSMPIFGARQKTQSIMQRLMANHNPIAIIEDNMRFAMKKQMDTDAKLTLIEHSQAEGLPAFTPRNADWVKSRGLPARENGALFYVTVDGERRHYTADPFMVSALKSGDVPVASLGSFIASVPKKAFTWSTTGSGAPWFAPTAGGRALEQGTITHPMGLTAGASGRSIPPVGMLASFNAVWRSAGPQMAHLWADRVASIENWMRTGPLNGSIPSQHLNTFARVLENAYTRSVQHRLEQAGAFSKSNIMDTETVAGKVSQQKIKYANTPVAPMLDLMERSANAALRFFGRRWKEPYGAHVEILRQAISDAPAFAFGHRLMTRQGGAYQHGQLLHDAQIAALQREHTGDPSVRGVPFTASYEGNKIPFKTQFKTRGQQNLADAAVGAGYIAHAAREAVPWAGVLVQSPAATIRALRENPLRANMAMVLTAVLPEATAYLWNAWLGQEYLDYVDAQSEYDYNNYTYFGMPGQPAYKGVKVIQPQETNLHRVLTKAWFKQWMGRAGTTMGQDQLTALKGFAQSNLIPPPNPLLGAMLAGTQGTVMPSGGLFSGELFKRRTNEFDPGYKESNLELALRQQFPGIADIGLQIMHAAGDAPAWADVPQAAWRQGTERVLEKTNVARDVARAIGLSSNPPVSGSPQYQDQAFKYRKQIDDMLKRYEIWDVGKGAISMKGYGVSPAGMARVGRFLPPLPPTDASGKIPNPGISIADPANPLYKNFMKAMENTFAHDNPEKGGIGYKALWKNYSIYTQLLDRLNTVSRGNDGAWVLEQQSKPKLMEYLRKNKVDPLNYKEVRNFYNYNRGLVTKTILNTIKATEQKFDSDPRMRQMLGPDKHFTLDMLDPNKAGLKAPVAE